MANSSIKIFIITHKECFIPKTSLLVPIQVGTALAQNHLLDMLHDDAGDNISAKNRMYCELTALYWVWKNAVDSEYTGFFHYRRYLNFSGKDLNPDCWGNIIYDKPLSDEILQELAIEDSNMENIIRKYDVIVPKPRTIPDGRNVYDEYVNAQGQHKRDLDTVIQILNEKYPEYSESAKAYLDSKTPYEVNMFIMRTELYEEYAQWLFDILFEAEKRLDFSEYNQYELRVMGFLSERLFGIWFTHNNKKRNFKTLELQKALFKNTDKPIEKITTEKNAVVAVLSCNDYYVPYLATMLQSIVQNAKQNRKYELFVLTTDISQDNQRKMKTLVETDNRFSFTCINVKSFAEKQDFFVHTHISVETYYRFFIFPLFADTEKVLYLDSDMVVDSDIAELYDTDLKDNYLAAAKDIDLAGSIKNNNEQSLYVKNDIGCAGADEYFQAGVLLFNIKEMKAKADLPDLIRVAQERNWNYMDQDILNHVYQKKICYLNQTWNCVMDWREPNASRMAILKDAPFALYNEYLEARKHPKIIHYAGYQKPWNKVNCDFAEYFWKYARQTEFYEEMLRRFFEATTYKTVAQMASLQNQINTLQPQIDNFKTQTNVLQSQMNEIKGFYNQLDVNLRSRRYFVRLYFGRTWMFRALRKILGMIKKR